MNLSELLNRLRVIRRRFWPYRRVFLGVSGGLVAVFAVLVAIKFVIPFFSAASEYLKRPFNTLSIINDPSKALRSSSGITNILILGRGGADHEAPDLTDTILLISVNLGNKKTSMISIPRDIWVDSMKAKINSAYYYGEQKQPGTGGLVLARDAVFQVTGLPIHYVVLVDFEGFKKAIDLVGGIDVDVKRGFVDEKYPVESEGQGLKAKGQGASEDTQSPIYETVKFEVGVQKMDGDTALKFVRSRNSSDPEEGTDFARSKRQQQIIQALAVKLKQKETVLNADRISELKKIFDQYVADDFSDDELLALGRVGMKINLGDIRHISIDEGTEDQPGLLVHPPTSKYGQWVLEPRSGDWSETHEYILKQLD